jgi:hypothetical protein
MKSKAYCFTKKTLINHIREELVQSLPSYRTNSVKFGGLSYPFMLYTVLDLFKYPKEEEIAHLNTSIRSLIEEKTFYQSLDERNIIHTLRNIGDIQAFPVESESRHELIKYLLAFMPHTSKELRKVIKTTSDEKTLSKIGNVKTLIDKFNIKKNRQVTIARSPVSAGVIRFYHLGLGFTVDLALVDPHSMDDLTSFKTLLDKEENLYQKVYFAFPNELAYLPSERAKNKSMLDPTYRNEDGPFIRQLSESLSIYKFTSESIPEIVSLFHNYKFNDVDYSLSTISIDKKMSLPLSLVFYATQFRKAFDFRFISPTPSKLVMNLANLLKSEDVEEAINISKDQRFLKLGYLAQNVECKHSKGFSCPEIESTALHEVLFDSRLWNDKFFVKYSHELSTMLRDIKADRAKNIHKKPFLLVANKAEAYQYVQAMSNPANYMLNDSETEILKNQKKDDFSSKLSKLHALFNVPVNDEFELPLGIDIDSFKSEVENQSDRIRNRWLIGSGFGRQELMDCFILRQITGKSKEML